MRFQSRFRLIPIASDETQIAERVFGWGLKTIDPATAPERPRCKRRSLITCRPATGFIVARVLPTK